MIDKGQWREIGQDTGVTPLLFTRSAMGFLMTRESGPRFAITGINYILKYFQMQLGLQQTIISIID